jgi:ATP-binding cassette subfamily G (WHITE) protein 2
MFLDEPTTGLDSTNAAKVVDILSGLGGIGVTVVLSIHQPRPDIFRLLDRVLVMSGTGSVVYSGPSAAAEGHFASLQYVPSKPETVNVADYMLDTVLRSSDEDVRRMIADFERSPAAAQTRNVVDALQARAQREAAWGDEAAVVGSGGGGAAGDAAAAAAALGIKNKYKASFSRQVRTLWQRMARNVRRHPFLITLHFVATGFAALSIGAIFFHAGRDTGGIQNRMGSLFFMLLYLTLMSLSSLPVWREDRLLFLRERASGAYGTDAYFTSMVCFDIFILRVLPPVFFTVITYPMVGLCTLNQVKFDP